MKILLHDIKAKCQICVCACRFGFGEPETVSYSNFLFHSTRFSCLLQITIFVPVLFLFLSLSLPPRGEAAGGANWQAQVPTPSWGIAMVNVVLFCRGGAWLWANHKLSLLPASLWAPISIIDLILKYIFVWTFAIYFVCILYMHIQIGHISKCI